MVRLKYPISGLLFIPRLVLQKHDWPPAIQVVNFGGIGKTDPFINLKLFQISASYMMGTHAGTLIYANVKEKDDPQLHLNQ
jgi:hypothetical protein